MRSSRQIRWAARGLGAGLTALLLVAQPTGAAAQAAKGDRLVVSPGKGDLLDASAAGAASADLPTASTTAAAKPEPVVLSRGTAARRLIDVAVRDDGVWLNSFTSRSMPLDAPACAELSEDIVAPLPVSAVERLAEEDLMRQTRVCGINGSLLVTCYGGSATVSLRPSKRGDGCR